MEALVHGLQHDDAKKALESLQKFVYDSAKVFAFPELEEGSRRKELWQAILRLASNVKDFQGLQTCFESIRILSRDKQHLNEVITSEWFDLIKKYSGLNSTSLDFAKDPKALHLAVEVEKSLCNLVYNSTKAAESCCSNGIVDNLVRRMQNSAAELQYFDVKLVFLLTALRPEIREKVKSDLDGLNILLGMLDGVLKHKEISNLALDDKEVDLICEILKAIFNLTVRNYGQTPEEDAQCEDVVKVLRLLLLAPTQNKARTCELQNNVINLLTNVPASHYQFLLKEVHEGHNLADKLRFEGDNMIAVYEIKQFLQDTLAEDKGVSRQNELLSPVLSVLLKAAEGNRKIRKYLRSQILPPLTDVFNRPEEGQTLRNQLCRLLTSPITQIKNMAAEFLFILCKKDVNRMIKYTGYGNAAGLFASKGLLGGRPDQSAADYSSDSEGSETEEYAEHKHDINPVTGCYEAPHPNPMANMSEEQKEYEAMKLVELIDNLTKCGAIKPCKVGADGKPEPIDHILQLRDGLKVNDDDDESDD